MKELIEIQGELKVNKGQFSEFGNYHYRNQDDILEAVKPLLKVKKCFIKLSDEMQLLGNRFYVIATATIKNSQGETEEAKGAAREIEEKKKFDGSQLTGTASAYARKTALSGLFALDDTKDADSMDNSKQTKKKEAPQKRKVSIDVIKEIDYFYKTTLKNAHKGKRTVEIERFRKWLTDGKYPDTAWEYEQECAKRFWDNENKKEGE